MNITFWGATRQVTGSMYMVEIDDYRILVDCGSNMEREEVPATKLPYPSSFSFEPSMVNLVVLTQAHVDHSGNLPNLVQEGYEGQILCTEPTQSLTELLLFDAASLNRRKLQRLQGGGKRRRSRSRRPAGRPTDTTGLYLEPQVKETLERLVPISFDRPYRAQPHIEVTLVPAGHLLGAAHVVIKVRQGNETTTIGFSGDLGRAGYPLLVDPAPMPPVDYLVCESTYGNRQHRDTGDPVDWLADVIRRTCVDQPGRLIVPAFSVGRTQALLYTLNRLYAEREFPEVGVYADSPLALKSTRVYERYARYLNAEARAFHEEHDELFDFANLHFVEDVKQSRALSSHHEPSILVSSSGMISGGRIEQHVRQNLQNPYCTILMIGYAAEHTVGGQLMRGAKTVRIGKDDLPVLATIESSDIFSGHGDLEDLLTFVGQQSTQQLKGIFLTHGEYPESMQHFRGELLARGYARVEMPARGDVFEL